jgi:hypothetical protein
MHNDPIRTIWDGLEPDMDHLLGRATASVLFAERAADRYESTHKSIAQQE